MSTIKELTGLLQKLDEDQLAVTAHFIRNMEAGDIAPDFIAQAMEYIHRHYTDILLRYQGDYCTDSRDADRVAYLLLLRDLFSCKELIW